MKSWKKSEIIEAVAVKAGQPKVVTNSIVNILLNTIEEKVKVGEAVLLQNFCKFYPVEVPEQKRFVHLEQVNREVVVPAHVRMNCKISGTVKDRLNKVN